MTLRDRMFSLTEIEHVDEFLKKYPTGAFFKAGGCHKTMQGFGYVEQALNPRSEIYMGFVWVVEHRPVSNYIAEITQITHQSPQLILMVEGKPVFDVDNWDITPEVLEEALDFHFGPVDLVTSTEEHHADVSSYLDLLSQYLEGNIPEETFRQKWLITFQSDATPRSSQQFNLLNSLFGDVDAALSINSRIGQTTKTLRDQAEKLYKALNREF
ncbi:MAG: DUF2847 family protein [Chlamydiales bacterium]